jgi:TatD DNase family protein
MVTFKNAQSLREVVVEVPTDRLLIETDSPYLAPVPMRGKRNEPAYITHTLNCLANLRGVQPTSLADQTSQNATRLFGLA